MFPQKPKSLSFLSVICPGKINGAKMTDFSFPTPTEMKGNIFVFAEAPDTI